MLLTSAGCGEAVPAPDYMTELVEVTGSVRVDGQPMEGIQVALVPQVAPGPDRAGLVRIGTGTTDAEGKFTIVTPPGGGMDDSEVDKYKGAVPGKYSATFSMYTTPDGKPLVLDPSVRKSPVDLGGIDRMPPMYGNPATTPHKVEVKAGAPNKFNFDIKLK